MSEYITVLNDGRSFFLPHSRPKLQSSVSISGRGLQSKNPWQGGEHLNPNKLSWANRPIQKESGDLIFCFVVETTKNETGETENRFNVFDFLGFSSVNSGCQSLRAEPGICLPLRQCPALRNQVRHLNPGRIFQYLEEYTYSCSVRGQVCCPGKYKPFYSGKHTLVLSSVPILVMVATIGYLHE